VEDGLEREISEGAGSIAVELLEKDAGFDAVLVPLGNGALLNGMARWLKSASPSTRVIGVAAAGAPAMAHSWSRKTVVRDDAVNTIADGVAVRIPVPEAVADMEGIVDDVLLVQDETLVDAMRLAHRHLGLVLEPAGALGVAAVLTRPEQFAGRHVAVVLSGGNLAPEAIGKYLS
jgi:threonine dehydratase